MTDRGTPRQGTLSLPVVSRLRSGDLDEIIFVVEEAPEGGYVARALGVPIFTEADDLDLLQAALRDAVLCHYEDEADRPRVIRLHFVRDSLIAA
jgi:hypothetical protein